MRETSEASVKYASVMPEVVVVAAIVTVQVADITYSFIGGTQTARVAGAFAHFPV